jgi:hypothetical protein
MSNKRYLKKNLKILAENINLEILAENIVSVLPETAIKLIRMKNKQWKSEKSRRKVEGTVERVFGGRAIFYSKFWQAKLSSHSLETTRAI